MPLKDHYKTLGIQPVAGQQEIKKAYRALAFKYHPDTNPDNAYTEAHFKELQEAYSILSNTNKRRQYDEERWLSGMSNRMQSQQAITPYWIWHECEKLARYMATIDTYRMSHRSLRDYIFVILSDSHMAVLKKENDVETNYKIIAALTIATKRLEAVYAQEIANKLYELAAGDEKANTVIETYLANHKKQEDLRKTLPVLAIIITLLLCVLMWLYGRK